MSETVQAVTMTTYQFEIDDDDWTDWKDTVPRSKALDERIRELIEADTEGRVQEEAEGAEPESRAESPSEPADPETQGASAPPIGVDGDLRDRLDALDFADPMDPAYTREDRVELLAAVYWRLEEADGDWVTRDDLRDLFETRPAGYGSEDSWFERFIQKYLPKLEEVEKRGVGASGMRIN